MSGVPDQLIRIANKALHSDFADCECEEGLARTTINRFYFGTYLLAREHLEGANPSNKFRTHTKVISGLRKYNKGLGNELRDLRDLRKGADYELETPISSAEAKESRRRSETIINALIKLKKTG